MTLKNQVLEAQNKIAEALSQSGRKRGVQIVAATKTRQPKLIEETIACGVKKHWGKQDSRGRKKIPNDQTKHEYKKTLHWTPSIK